MKNICICIGFVCDFIDFFLNSLLKEQSTQLPAMKAVTSYENMATLSAQDAKKGQ
jgi:hypothetical protein